MSSSRNGHDVDDGDVDVGVGSSMTDVISSSNGLSSRRRNAPFASAAPTPGAGSTADAAADVCNYSATALPGPNSPPSTPLTRQDPIDDVRSRFLGRFPSAASVDAATAPSAGPWVGPEMIPAEILPPIDGRIAAALLEDPDVDRKVAALRTEGQAAEAATGTRPESSNAGSLFAPLLTPSNSATSEEIEGGATRGPSTRSEPSTNANVNADTEDAEDAGLRNARITRLTSLFHIPIAWVVRDEPPPASVTFPQGDELPPAPVTFHEGEVVVAERVGFWDRKWRMLAFVMCLLLLLMALLILLYEFGGEDESTSAMPSMQPSFPPSFDSRTTLQIVQMRGHVRCGLGGGGIDSGMGSHTNMCRSIAAVLFGNPDKIERVGVKSSTNFELLNDRSVDLLAGGVTYTIEREVRERRTGVGFTFSSPFYYDGISYFGDETFVRCAEEQKRYQECSSLRICVTKDSTNDHFVRYHFPSDFFVVGPTNREVIGMLFDDKCNVVASDRRILLDLASRGMNGGEKFIVGDKMVTTDPLAIVTRNSDDEFSDIINWVIQALFYGEEQGLTRDASLCQTYADLTPSASDLNFLNAVHCVGAYNDIFFDNDNSNRGINQINDGTTGMLYAIPFGQLDHVVGNSDSVASSSLLREIRRKGSLNCGVIIPDEFTGGSATGNMLGGMSVDFCHILAAALFNGDHEAVTLLKYSDEEDDSFVSLDNGTIDVLSGARVNQKHEFQSSPSLKGFRFSTPYYYGNETSGDDVSFFSLATRGDDVLVSSFVNCVVVATVYAQDMDITKERSREMPSVSIFGSKFGWALRDAIAYSGSYDQIYTKHFGDGQFRGRNVLNDGGPQIHSFPGLRD